MGAVITWSTFLVSGLIYGFVEMPSLDSINYKYKSQLTASIYAEQNQEYRNNNREYQMVDAIWPSTTDEKIIESACSKNTTPERLKICSERTEKTKYLWLDWIKHIFLAIGVALLSSAVAGLLWWAFSWVLLGFTLPKDLPPKS